ncbi:imidazolonepropionase [Candidatus Kryptobacter tengchongensis]|nr:imidazolonepropionase [Candidatus Kryptobacter tengchongensis]
MILIHNANQVVTVASFGKRFKRGEKQSEIFVVEKGSVLIKDGKIEWVGRAVDFNFGLYGEVEIIDATGKVVLPGFVDSHTHLVFGGTREDEFNLRIKGFTYQQIAEMGGGILSTVQKTRNLSKDELLKISQIYATKALANGTTTIEIKSGYGLNLEDEIKVLEVVNELNEKPIFTVPTFLGAHAVPPEFKDRKDDYVKFLVDKLIPEISKRKLAKFCDVFCEIGYFTAEDSEKILTAGKSYGLLPKIHAEQFSNYGGVKVGVKVEAISIDHLENINDEDIDLLSRTDSIAVLLPGVSFFLNYKYPPARKLIDSGVPVAIATDFNPGSCMSLNMQLMMTIACTQMRMTIEEAITASTLNSAGAIGISDITGSIEVGKRADLVIFDVPDYRMIPYFFGENHTWIVFGGGILKYRKM